LQVRASTGRLPYHVQSTRESEPEMKTNRRIATFYLVAVAMVAAPACAADRIRAGQWTGTTIIGAKTFPTTSCISPGDAAAINGDAKTFQAYLETIIPPAICKISEVKVEGIKVIYTATCGKVPSKVVTTSYYGDRSEGTDSTGSKTEAKWVGPCK
jgi:hypothetical protein